MVRDLKIQVVGSISTNYWLALSGLFVTENSVWKSAEQIDLFRLYILFSQYRSCDDTQEIWSFVLFIKKSIFKLAFILFNEQDKWSNLLSIITWSVLGKQNVQAKKVYYSRVAWMFAFTCMSFRFVSKQRKTFNAVGMSLIFWLQARELRLSVCFNISKLNRSLNKRRMSLAQTITTAWTAEKCLDKRQTINKPPNTS